MKNKKIILFLLTFILVISTAVFAYSETEVYVERQKRTDEVKIIIYGEKESLVNIVVKDNNRIYLIDEVKLDNSGKAEIKTLLKKDKEYDIKLVSNGDIINKKIKEEDKIEEEIKNKKVKLYIEGYKGVILSEKNILVENGESVLDLTKRILDSNKIKYKERDGYIYSIDNQSEYDKGKGSGWMYTVNGKFPNKGADSLRAKDYKSIEWKYTYDLGKDIGAKKNWYKVEDSLFFNINQILEELKEENIKEKDMNKLLKTLNKEIENIENKKILTTSEDIIDTLLDIEIKNISSRNAEELLKIVCKSLELVNTKLEDKDYTKLSNLSVKSLNIYQKYYKKLDNKELKDISKNIVNTISKIEKREKQDVNKEKISIIKVNLLNEISYLPKELIDEIKVQNIDVVKFYNKNINFELASKDISTDLNIELVDKDGKIKLSIISDNKDLNIIKPIKITINNINKDKNIMLKSKDIEKNLGGFYFENKKQITTYTNKLGEFYLEEKILTFNDLSDVAWAKEYIESLASKGIVNGLEDSKFSPKLNLTRAEFSTMVVRMLNLDTVNNEKIFNDVDKDKWYFDYINTLYSKSYINGKSKEIFDPNGSITREEMSKVLANILKDHGYKFKENESLKEFKDSSNISNWAKDEVALLVKNKAIKGHDNMFNPKNNATRAEAATLIYRVYELMMK